MQLARQSPPLIDKRRQVHAVDQDEQLRDFDRRRVVRLADVRKLREAVGDLANLRRDLAARRVDTVDERARRGRQVSGWPFGLGITPIVPGAPDLAPLLDIGFPLRRVVRVRRPT